MSFKLIFAWYDMWVGLFWDVSKRRLYIFPIPMFGLMIQFGPRRQHSDIYLGCESCGQSVRCDVADIPDDAHLTCPECYKGAQR